MLTNLSLLRLHWVFSIRLWPWGRSLAQLFQFQQIIQNQFIYPTPSPSAFDNPQLSMHPQSLATLVCLQQKAARVSLAIICYETLTSFANDISEDGTSCNKYPFVQLTLTFFRPFSKAKHLREFIVRMNIINGLAALQKQTNDVFISICSCILNSLKSSIQRLQKSMKSLLLEKLVLKAGKNLKKS